jgi:PBP1b-binding outer membrane lipoprotein LpoB
MKLIKYILILLLISLLAAGCGDRRDEPGDEERRLDTTDTLVAPEIDTLQTDTTAADTAGQAQLDLTGTWTGTFDQRATTMKITEHQGNAVGGVVTINYRDPLNQTVKGTLNTENQTLTLKDQVHSRYRGTYNGKISEDGRRFSGTFTMDLDGSKINFNLTKK